MPNKCFPIFFRAVGHPIRQRILKELHKAGESSVIELSEKFNLSQSTVSHHLLILKKAGAVKSRKKGTYAFYSACCGEITKCCDIMKYFFKKIG